MIRKIVIGVALVLALLLGGVAVALYNGLHRLAKEDLVPDKYMPMVEAICAYADSNGVPPSALSELEPAFMTAAPEAGGEVVSYQRMPDGTNWCLTIQTQIEGRSYSYAMWSDRSRMATGTVIHGWEVRKKRTG